MLELEGGGGGKMVVIVFDKLGRLRQVKRG